MLQCYKCDGVKGQDLPCDGASGKGKEVAKHDADFAWFHLSSGNTTSLETKQSKVCIFLI